VQSLLVPQLLSAVYRIVHKRRWKKLLTWFVYSFDWSSINLIESKACISKGWLEGKHWITGLLSYVVCMSCLFFSSLSLYPFMHILLPFVKQSHTVYNLVSKFLLCPVTTNNLCLEFFVFVWGFLYGVYLQNRLLEIKFTMVCLVIDISHQ
jgi:hypothetical protein